MWVVTHHILSALCLQVVRPSHFSCMAFWQRTGVTHTFWRLLHHCLPFPTARKNDLSLETSNQVPTRDLRKHTAGASLEGERSLLTKLLSTKCLFWGMFFDLVSSVLQLTVDRYQSWRDQRQDFLVLLLSSTLSPPHISVHFRGHL